jgi:molybdate transport system substrate-binding protein
MPKPLSWLVASLCAALVACGAGGADDAAELRVFAASSLTDVFPELSATFSDRHPGTEVTFQFGGSSALAQQVNEGAPADVLATADTTTMTSVVDAGNATAPVVFARNRLALVVEPGNPLSIDGFADLGDPGVVLSMCAAEVPCGRLARLALEQAGVDVEPSSSEPNVRGVVGRVTLGEADVGIVFETDARAAAADGEAAAVELEGLAHALDAVYSIAITAAARDEDLAGEWIDFVRSADGQHVLRAHGFLPP